MAKQVSSPSEHEKDAPAPARQDRLAAALRANLARRKAQARARGGAAQSAGGEAETAHTDDFAGKPTAKPDFDP